jgi:uncharacterized membrane protein
MPGLQHHLRTTLLSGAFAVIPIAITIAIVIYIENATRAPLKSIGLDFPGLGIVLAVLAIYLTGLFISSLVGRFFLRKLDHLITRLPVLNELYKAWKQISFTPGGGEGIYGKVVLIPDGRGQQHVLAFTSGEPVCVHSETVAVFVPNSPNPVTGRVAFVHQRDLILLNMTSEEAFKLLLSSGNYVPPAVIEKLSKAPAAARDEAGPDNSLPRVADAPPSTRSGVS